MAFEPAPFHGAESEGPGGGSAFWTRAEDGVRVKVTEAEVVYVHIDRTGRPAELKRRSVPHRQPAAGP